MYAMTLVLLSTLLTLEGGLLTERAPQPGLLLGASEVTAPGSTPSLAELTPEQLRAARTLALDARPSILAPALIIGGGAVVLTVGLGVLLFSSVTIGAVILAVSAAVLAVGVVLVLLQGPARATATARLKAIDAELTERRARDLRTPVFEQQTPPPGVQLAPEPGLRLASF